MSEIKRPKLIVDGHCHLSSSRCIPGAFFDGVVSNINASLTAQGVQTDSENIKSMLLSQYDDHYGDKLVSQMNDAGIEKTVLLAPDFTYIFESDFSYRDLAKQHFETKKRHPDRFFVFQGIDPRWGQTGLKFFEYCIKEYQFDGLKLYPPCGYSPSDKRLYPFYELCQQYGLPVLLHTGPTSPTLNFEMAVPSLIDQAAKDFTKVNFILAHGGVNFVEQSKLLCQYRPNVFLDFSGFPSVLNPNGWKSHLYDLFRLKINHKVIFGSDWPVFSMKESLSAMIEGLMSDDGPLRDANNTDIKNIMAGNILRLIGQRQ
ncbi:hypothetical protein ALT761_03364 [Alteromonas sp. 76-1]|jgi:predicted TIM-barrel fold metal-dependent hydrolase|uniref:amidohydrolase family protein n=1 Tax=Alteromonas sp. 76-1 TaxID=2358187 RepID=UPI000FD15ECD|nr:amidohydrolase family protein [Alteromonas sp. 76-1]VEL98346.1 hypothetical protein ALT761_03364 [Alteromonas sp. 76-1]